MQIQIQTNMPNAWYVDVSVDLFVAVVFDRKVDVVSRCK